MEQKYIIIKKITKQNGVVIPVILLDGEEVMEFYSLEEAEKIKDIFQANSDSGHIYEVKKI
jgi:alpha-amylase/alpha-mannosidase (GH57 family)